MSFNYPTLAEKRDALRRAIENFESSARYHDMIADGCRPIETEARFRGIAANATSCAAALRDILARGIVGEKT